MCEIWNQSKVLIEKFSFVFFFSSVMKNSQEVVRASLLPLFNNIAEDLNWIIQNLEQKHYNNIKGTLQRGTTSLTYIHMVLLPVLSSLLDHLGKNNYGVDVFSMTFTRRIISLRFKKNKNK